MAPTRLLLILYLAITTAGTLLPIVILTVFLGMRPRHRHAGASLDHYASDASLINPDGTHAVGADAIHTLFTAVFAAFAAHIQFMPRTTVQAGGLAYDRGSWNETLTGRVDHKTIHTKGDYLTVSRRSADGHWRIVQQVWTQAQVAP